MIRTSNVFAGNSSIVPVPSAASSAKLYFRTDLANVDQTITFGATAIAVEVINDDTSNNVAVNFTGTAAIPTSSTSLTTNHLILPKEARYFPVQATSMHIISSSASAVVDVRVTIFYQ